MRQAVQSLVSECANGAIQYCRWKKTGRNSLTSKDARLSEWKSVRMKLPFKKAFQHAPSLEHFRRDQDDTSALLGSGNRLDVNFLALFANRTSAACVVSAQALNLRLITTARH